MNKKEKTKKSKKEKPKSKPVFHKKSDAGKGDVPRMGISLEEWSDRWDKIFGVGKYRKETD